MIIFVAPEEIINDIVDKYNYFYEPSLCMLSFAGSKTALKVDNTKKYLEYETIADFDYYKENIDFEEMKELLSRFYHIDFAYIPFTEENFLKLSELAYEANI